MTKNINDCSVQLINSVFTPVFFLQCYVLWNGCFQSHLILLTITMLLLFYINYCLMTRIIHWTQKNPVANVKFEGDTTNLYFHYWSSFKYGNISVDVTEGVNWSIFVNFFLQCSESALSSAQQATPHWWWKLNRITEESMWHAWLMVNRTPCG